jgi:hypothetical protein
MGILETWADVDPLTIDQAACLWCEADPAIEIWRHPANVKSAIEARTQMLLAAAAGGTLAVSAPIDNLHRFVRTLGKHLVTRAELRRFASSRSQEPGFLFGRPPPSPEQIAFAEARAAEKRRMEELSRQVAEARRRPGGQFSTLGASPSPAMATSVVAEPQLSPGLTVAAAPLRKAKEEEVRKAIGAIYDEADANTSKPPNLKELPPLVRNRLARAGCTATHEKIGEIADEVEFRKRRGRVGVTRGNQINRC